MRMCLSLEAARVSLKDLQTQLSHCATLLLIVTNTTKPVELLFQLKLKVPLGSFFYLYFRLSDN